MATPGDARGYAVVASSSRMLRIFAQPAPSAVISTHALRLLQVRHRIITFYFNARHDFVIAYPNYTSSYSIGYFAGIIAN